MKNYLYYAQNYFLPMIDDAPILLAHLLAKYQFPTEDCHLVAIAPS